MIFKFDDSIKNVSGQVAKATAELIKSISINSHNISCENSVWKWIEDNLLKNTTYTSRWDYDIISKNLELRDISLEKQKYLSEVIVGTNHDMLTPQEALVLVNKPSLVIVENETNDWPVIRKWIDLFKNEKKYKTINTIVCKRKDNKYLKAYNAGSCGQIINTIDQRIKEYGRGTKYKITTVLDSDKTNPTDAFSNEKLKIMDHLSDKNIEGHILFKREMENYFPIKVYEKAKKIKGNKDIPKFTEEEWDYVDVENTDFIKYKKKDLPELTEYLEKNDLYERINTQNINYMYENMNEIQMIILKLAKLS